MNAAPKRKRWRRGSITGGLLILLALSIYFIPSIFLRQYVTGYLAEQGLEVRGLGQVHINLYGPSLETDELTLTDNQGTVFHLDGFELFLEFTPLVQKRIDVGGANLVGLELYVSQLDDGTISLRGLPPANKGASSGAESDTGTLSGWLFGVTHVEMENTTVHLELNSLRGDLNIDELVLDNVKMWMPSQVSSLTANGSFEGATFSLDLEVLPFAEDPGGTLKFVGEAFPLENIDIGSPLTGLVGINVTASIEATGEQDNLTATVAGTVTSDNLEAVLESGDKSVTARIESQESSLKMIAQGPRDNLTTHAEGSSRLQNLVLAGEDITLVAVNSASLEQWSWENDEFHTPEIFVESGSLSSTGEATLASFETLSITELSYTPGEKGSVADIALGTLTGSVTLTRDGIVELGDVRSYFPAPGDDQSDESTAVHWSADFIHLADQAQIQFTDRTLTVPARYGLNVDTLTLSDFNTAKPEALSDFELIAAIDNAGELQISGGVAPLTTPSPSFNLEIDIHDLEMPRASPYAASYLGINLERGQLNMHATGISEAGKLDAKTGWKLERVQVSLRDDYSDKLLAQQLDVPVTTAVKLLQDRDGDIDLDVPVSGQLNSPDFDLADAISQAMAKAMQGALLTSIKIAFPVVALADLVISGGEVRLKPVVFAPLQDTPGEEASTYIDSLAELMNKRPKVAITTCGVAVHDDFRALRVEAFEKQVAESRASAGYPLEAEKIDTEAVDPGSDAADTPPNDLMDAPITDDEREQLQILAEERSARVEAILREEYGIDASRLFDCRPDVKPDDQDTPRVRVTL